MLAVADLDVSVGKRYRAPIHADLDTLAGIDRYLESETPFEMGLPAVPTEPIDPGLSRFIGPVNYGYRSWGELCNARQTLGLVRLTRIIDTICNRMLVAGVSNEYAAALTGYSASNLVRILKFSTRSATLFVLKQHVGHIFFNDSGVSHSFDYFEVGCGEGPGSWRSLAPQTARNLRKQLDRVVGGPVVVQARLSYGVTSARRMPGRSGNRPAV